MSDPYERPPRLEPMIIRIPPAWAEHIRALSRESRVPASEYLREAVADLLRKYERLPRPSTEAK